MTVCNKNCRKWTTLLLGIVFLIFGVFCATYGGQLFDKILNYELGLSSPHTKGYNMWKETPLPMYLEFHLFNWTNPEEFEKYPSVKPIFVECGPYVFYEHHIRENVTFNDNNTITYKNKRLWKFLPEKTNGSLNDKITTVNPVALTVGNIIKHEHLLIRKTVNFLFEDFKVTLAVTKTVNEFLFEGYEDKLLHLAQKLNISGLNVPYKKFGWFVERNGSIDYDGVWNMYNGADDINKLGIIKKWNYEEILPYYHGECSKVNGTSGELWYPPKYASEISIFSNDLCSSVRLHLNGTEEFLGVRGTSYVGTNDNFDNGTTFPESKCYTTDGVALLSGVRNVSSCKFNAPAFVSYPNFYLADPAYSAAVVGMKPDPQKHQFKIILEPSTGLPLSVHAAFQVNLFLQKIEGLKIFANVKDIVMPSMWFLQKAEMTPSLINQAKMLLILPHGISYTGYGFILISSVLLFIYGYVTYRKAWKSKEEDQLLDPQPN